MRQTKRRRQSGFSLIELMMAILILMIIMGAVFGEIDNVQRRYRTEEVKLDMFQTAREFMDQMVRDIHQAGFPNTKLSYYPTPGANWVNAAALGTNAVGVYYISPTELRFEGDVDGDGTVDVVAYKLFPQSNAAGDANCPCLRRSQVLKADGVDPMSQAVDWRTQVENIRVPSNDPTNISGVIIFVPYKKDGTPISPWTGSTTMTKTNFDPKDDGDPAHYTGADPMNAIWSVRIMLTVEALTTDVNIKGKPQAYLTAAAQVNN